MTPYVKICATILLVNINEIKKHIDGVARHVYHRVQVNTIDMVLLSFVLTHGLNYAHMDEHAVWI